MVRAIAIWLIAFSLALMLQTCTPTTPYTGTDKIDFSNRPSLVAGPVTAFAPGGGPVAGLLAEAGVLVDGRLGPDGLHVNDAGFVSSDNRLGIPNRVPRDFWDIFYPDRRQEIIAFTNGRRPEFVRVSWGWGEDVNKVAFKEPVGIPVTIWILTGPPATHEASMFEQQRIQVLEAVVGAASIWKKERGGFRFADLHIFDATLNPNRLARAIVPDGVTEANTWKPLRDEIGFEPLRLNIYWIETLNNSTTTGASNFDTQIILGRESSDGLLVHEIGHALDLRHTNTTDENDFNPPEVLAKFDNMNIMHNGSLARAFITEGQIVRMHWNHSSIVWTLLPDAGQSLPRPDCPHLQHSGSCPAIFRRIWADGALPADN